jgi:hypothetical protein
MWNSYSKQLRSGKSPAEASKAVRASAYARFCGRICQVSNTEQGCRQDFGSDCTNSDFDSEDALKIAPQPKNLTLFHEKIYVR